MGITMKCELESWLTSFPPVLVIIASDTSVQCKFEGFTVTLGHDVVEDGVYCRTEEIQHTC